MKGASPIAKILDPQARRLARARFAAWWNGAEFDAEAAQAAIAAEAEAAESLLFETPPDPRLDALARFWGAHRLMPGSAEEEAAIPGLLELNATGLLLVLGPGGRGPVEALASTHPGDIEVCEWREEARATLGAALKGLGLSRVGMRSFDLETGSFPPESLEGLVSFDDFSHCANAPRLALQIAKGLKPGGRALVACYTGLSEGPAFAASFAEPQVLPAKALREAMFEAGLRIEADDDVTDAHIALARDGFKALAGGLETNPPTPEALREIGWEARAWAARLKLLADRRLERRRFLAVKR